jgi:long-chain acyl-CoA synthetase
MELTAGMVLPLSRGASIVLPRVLAANEIMQALSEDDVTVMIAVPRLFRNIMEGMQKKFSQGSPFLRAYIGLLRILPLPLKKLVNGPIRSKVGSNIKVWVSGGSRLDPAISGFFRDLGIPLRQGYGITECSPVISVQRAWEPQLDGVGPPFEDVEIRIENPDENGCGVLWVKGPNLMLGYADENQTAEVMVDGWYNTGDIARLDKGQIVLTGRSKRLIVTEAGKNVYPEDLEVLMERQESVKEAGITEIDMRPAAVLAIDGPDAREKGREAVKFYNSAVSTHNQIVRFAVVEDLPKTPLGKVALASLPQVFASNEVV